MELPILENKDVDVRVTVIIPTLCDAKRRHMLDRAIKSIHGASLRSVKILVVVNGQRFDPDAFEQLRSRGDVEVVQLAEASQTLAQLEGRRRVNTELFGFLDDDDEYLPGGLDVRVEAFERHPSADVVVTNGFRATVLGERPIYSHFSAEGKSPMAHLFQENWLASGNHLFKAATVSSAYFEDSLGFMEWTWLAFKLASDGREVYFLDLPTFLYNDTPESLSKSGGFMRSRCALYERMRSRGVDAATGKVLARKTCDAWHEVSVRELESGNVGKALGAHLRSLVAHWSGLRFLPYTRYLLNSKASTRGDA